MEQPQQQQHLRGLRDFLLAYNQMTELCFQRCAADLNYRVLTGQEESCLAGCAGKLVRSNHRLMAAYVRLMPSLVQRRLADYEADHQADSNSSSSSSTVAVAPTGPPPPPPPGSGADLDSRGQ